MPRSGRLRKHWSIIRRSLQFNQNCMKFIQLYKCLYCHVLVKLCNINRSSLIFTVLTVLVRLILIRSTAFNSVAYVLWEYSIRDFAPDHLSVFIICALLLLFAVRLILFVFLKNVSDYSRLPIMHIFRLSRLFHSSFPYFLWFSQVLLSLVVIKSITILMH